MTLSKSLIGIINYILLGSWIVAGCNPILQPVAPTATLIPTCTPTRAITPTRIPALTATPIIPDTGWTLLHPGLERRVINIQNEQGQWVESLYMLRLDQNQFRLDVAYHEAPQTLENWQKETHALVVVNGGYFQIQNDQYIPNGLTIVNGQTLGSSYGSFAGMLAVTANGTELRWLTNKPYRPNEQMMAALQSFPVLIKPGGKLGFPEQYEDNLQARRTVIGQDKEGNILLMVASEGYFTLHQLSVYLTESDLNLDIAINLDGGPSSGILLADPQEIIPALSLLPLVITVYAR